jgi:hypothetical protein
LTTREAVDYLYNLKNMEKEGVVFFCFLKKPLEYLAAMIDMGLSYQDAPRKR